MSKIVLIDGHSILNRAFYGVPDLTNSEGLHTNAVYGFLNIMFMILEEESPDHLVVVFDVHAPTFRHELFPEYKGTRSPMAPELREQVPLIQDVLKSMNICVKTLPGYEADDLLGTIAKRCQADGLEVSLVSGDRDLLQISDEHIKIRIPKTKGGKTTIEDYYPGDVLKEYQVTPEVFIDMKALMGDTSDNVHGVSGVGPKSAAKLLIQYGSIDGIYAHIDEMKASAVKENLIRDKEQAYLARTLVTIKTDVPVEFALSESVLGDMFNPASYEFFKKLEFKNFLNRFESGMSSTDVSAIEEGFIVIDDLNAAEEFFAKMSAKVESTPLGNTVVMGIYAPLDSCIDDLKAVSITTDGEKVTTVLCTGFITSDYLQKRISAVLSSEKVIPVSADIKEQYSYIDTEGVEDRAFDICIAAYLIDPLKSEYDHSYIASLYLNEDLPDRSAYMNKTKSYSELFDASSDNLCKLSAHTVRVAFKSYGILNDRLSETGMSSLFRDIEMPLSRVLYSMESTGVKVESGFLSHYSEELGSQMSVLEEAIYEKAGEKFNILSPKQLGVILFEKMGLKGGKKTKTGYSTSADVLEKLSDEPIVRDILNYRALSKLKSTYADGLTEFIASDGRIHTTFKQTMTATGRLSSADPNLQNIPTRTELGRQLRHAFVPSEGCVFVDADYSQIELRILAHMAGDEELIKAYSEDLDIHRITASRVFGKPLDEVTDLDRRRAKAVNFGVVYGISSYGLSEDIGITRKEAEEYIRNYFETFPGIRKYLDSCVSDAKEKGYALTAYGRRRPIPELNSSNFMQRQFGERVAMNSPIQGTAADIMKIAMIRVYRSLLSKGLRSRMVLQVHDELLIDTYPEELDEVRALLSREMENAASLKVRLKADSTSGSDWFEAK